MTMKNSNSTRSNHLLKIRIIRRGTDICKELIVRSPQGWVLVTIAAMLFVIVLIAILHQ